MENIFVPKIAMSFNTAMSVSKSAQIVPAHVNSSTEPILKLSVKLDINR